MLIESVIVIGSTSALAVATPYLIALAAGTTAVGGTAAVGGTGGIAGLVYYLKRKKRINAGNTEINNELETIDETEAQNMELLTETTDSTKIELQEDINEAIDKIKEGSEEMTDKTDALQKVTLDTQDKITLIKKVIEDASEQQKPALQIVLTHCEALEKDSQKLKEAQEKLSQIIKAHDLTKNELTQEKDTFKKHVKESKQIIESLTDELQNAKRSNQSEDSSGLLQQIHLLNSKLVRSNQLIQTLLSQQNNHGSDTQNQDEPSSTRRFGLFGSH